MADMNNASSNTTSKQRKPGGITGKGFVPGDPRINRKGRPNSFDKLRALAQKISHEQLTGKDGSTQTVVEAILRKLALDNPERFLEIAYGKVPHPVDVTTNGKDLPLKVVPYDYTAAAKAISARDEDDEKG